MGPLRVLLEHGANVIGVDLNRPSIWQKLFEIVDKSCGTLTFPLSKPQVRDFLSQVFLFCFCFRFCLCLFGCLECVGKQTNKQKRKNTTKLKFKKTTTIQHTQNKFHFKNKQTKKKKKANRGHD